LGWTSAAPFRERKREKQKIAAGASACNKGVAVAVSVFASHIMQKVNQKKILIRQSDSAYSLAIFAATHPAASSQPSQTNFYGESPTGTYS
jgi:hypothetical protein